MLFVHILKEIKIWIISTFFSGFVRPKQKETAVMLLYMFLLSQQQITRCTRGTTHWQQRTYMFLYNDGGWGNRIRDRGNTQKMKTSKQEHPRKYTHRLWLYIQASQFLRMTKLLMGTTWFHFTVLLSVSPVSVWRIQASSALHLQKRRGLLARLLPGHFCTRNSKWIKHQSLKQVRLVGVTVLEEYDDALL